MSPENRDRFISAGKDGTFLAVHIQPRASKNEVCGIHGSELKIRLTSPPVDGAANKLCQEFLSELFGIPKSKVSIASGEKSRHKKVLLHGVSVEEATSLLNRFETH